MENIVILGSTGSIGTQTLEVIREQEDKFRAYALVGGSNVELLIDQCLLFKPEWAVIQDYRHYGRLKESLSSLPIKVRCGAEGISEVLADPQGTTVLAAISGFAGLKSTVESIKHKKKIALANKETLVAGGDYIMGLAREHGVRMLPVDSEHSAIFQCLDGKEDYLKKIILTASGGPFRERDSLDGITPGDALKHPNWSMGQKITIDSATLANKGLEVIEAHYLFNCDYDNIDVVIHKESIIHSLVEFKDTALLAQLGFPSMKLPILYALSYPKREEVTWESLSLGEIGTLHFEKPRREVFRALDLAYQAGREGAAAPIIYNGANEIAVELFLKGAISFIEISELIEKALENVERGATDSLEGILEIDKAVRQYVKSLFRGTLN